MKTVEIDEKDWEAFQDYQERRKKKELIVEIKARFPNALGTGVKNHIENWLVTLNYDAIKVIHETYNPIPTAPPPGRNQPGFGVLPAAHFGGDEF